MPPSAAFPPSLTCAAGRSVSSPLPLCCCSLSFFCCLAHRYSLQAPPRHRVLPTPTPSPSVRRTRRDHPLAGLFLCHARRCGRSCPRERAEPAAKAADKASRLVGPSFGKGHASRTSAAVYLQAGHPLDAPLPQGCCASTRAAICSGGNNSRVCVAPTDQRFPLRLTAPPPPHPHSHPVVFLPDVGGAPPPKVAASLQCTTRPRRSGQPALPPRPARPSFVPRLATLPPLPPPPTRSRRGRGVEARGAPPLVAGRCRRPCRPPPRSTSAAAAAAGPPVGVVTPPAPAQRRCGALPWPPRSTRRDRVRGRPHRRPRRGRRRSM